MSNIKMIETVKESRSNGTIIEQIERIYGLSRFSDTEKVLTDLISRRYVFSKNIDFVSFNDTNFLEGKNLLKTVFESHMKNFIKPINDIRWYTDSPYSSKTLLNGKDISYLYGTVEGKDKNARIYDLYNGIINKRNSNDIFSIHLGLISKQCFGYREISKITEKELICLRKSYYHHINDFFTYIYIIEKNDLSKSFFYYYSNFEFYIILVDC